VRVSSRKAFSFFFMVLALAGCGGSGFDGSTLAGKAAILDEVDRLLSAGECLKAVELIDGLYNTVNVDNEVRLARAASHACVAGVTDFFGLLTTLAGKRFDTVAGEGSYLFRTVAEVFNSSGVTYSYRSRAAENANFALMASVKVGTLVERAYQVSPETFNPGSLRSSDRISDANFFAIFNSMAWLGALQNQYSAPDINTWKKTRPLGYSAINTSGWVVATANQGDGCAYSAALLNLLDGLDQSTASLPSSLKDPLTNISGLSSLLAAACEAGCQGVASTGAILSGCSFPAGSCATCPLTLRNPTSCTGAVDDKNSCAAAGIADFISNSAAAGWVGP
jgi:hypothetical protein